MFDAVVRDAARIGDRFVESINLTNSGWAHLALGEACPELFVRHLELSLEIGNEDGMGYAFEGMSACAALVGDVERAGVLLGIAETARKRTGLIEQRLYISFQPFVEQLEASDRAAEFMAGRARGQAMSRRAALELVLAGGTVNTATDRVTG
jgi:hypothetical protein